MNLLFKENDTQASFHSAWYGLHSICSFLLLKYFLFSSSSEKGIMKLTSLLVFGQIKEWLQSDGKTYQNMLQWLESLANVMDFKSFSTMFSKIYNMQVLWIFFIWFIPSEFR